MGTSRRNICHGTTGCPLGACTCESVAEETTSVPATGSDGSPGTSPPVPLPEAATDARSAARLPADIPPLPETMPRDATTMSMPSPPKPSATFCTCACHRARPEGFAQVCLPPLPPAANDAAVRLYDLYVACLVLSINFHRHTETCRKGKTGNYKCRVGYPAAANDMHTAPMEIDYTTPQPDGKPRALSKLSPPPDSAPSTSDATYPFPGKDYRFVHSTYSLHSSPLCSATASVYPSL